MKAQHLYQFKQFRFDKKRLILWHEDEIVQLTPKALKTLFSLIKREGEVVSKEELMEEVWEDSFVEENNLSRNIHELRKVFERHTDEKFIETVPLRGYRFIGKLHENGIDETIIEREVIEQTLIESFPKDNELSLHDSENINQNLITKDSNSNEILPVKFWRNPRLILISAGVFVLFAIGVIFWINQNSKKTSIDSFSNIESIAVLPLKSFSSNVADKDLRLKITDALITKLGSFNQIAVRPTSSILSFDDNKLSAIEAGKKLKVDAVLDGRIQKENNRLRVTIQIISVRNGENLWSEQFDGQAGEILTLQDKIGNSLQKRFTFLKNEDFNKRPTESSEAFEAYLKGRYLWNQRKAESYWKALEFFQESVVIDPNFALGYTGIADCYLLLSQRGITPDKVFPKAEKAAQKALELDPTLAEAHTSIAVIKHLYYGRWKESEDYFKKAIELNPNYANAHALYGMLLSYWGRFDEAHKELNEAKRLDPTSLNIGTFLGVYFYFTEQYEAAEKQFQEIIKLAPNFSETYGLLAMIYEQKGLYKKATEAEIKRRKISNSYSVEPLQKAFETGGTRAFWKKQIDLLKDESATKPGLQYEIATRYALLGENAKALAQIASVANKDSQKRDTKFLAIKVDPAFKALRSNEKFQLLSQKLNLPN